MPGASQMPDQSADPAGQLVVALLAQHNGDVRAALADLARMYLVARHGWCPGFSRIATVRHIP